jgi:cobyrinic acid a,c-diamide synthase
LKIIGVTAPSTGSGKTTVSLAITHALENSVSIKVGPDYIDPIVTRASTGHDTYNMDRWIQGRNYRDRIDLLSLNHSYAVVEGVMGFYDSGSTMNVSTEYYFSRLKIPYILVVDVSKLAESAYHMARGFINRRCVGVVINNYFGDRHLSMVQQEFLRHGIRIVGRIPHDAGLAIEERHLGLNVESGKERMKQVAPRVAEHLDMEFIERSAAEYVPRRHVVPPGQSCGPLRIAVAYDDAFSFYYASSLDFLSRHGQVTFFSPIANQSVPDADMIYIGGGYPEMHSDRLEQSAGTKEWILAHHESGRPIIAECGGLMYLMDTIAMNGARHGMVGLFHGVVNWEKKVTIGYTRLRCDRASVMFRKGDTVMGHEYHYSTISTDLDPSLTNVIGKGINGKDGLTDGNAFASYSHFDLQRYGERVIRSALRASKDK